MDPSTWIAWAIVLIWILWFLDGNAVHELRLFFHALTKAVCHLYLALLPLRRAAGHFFDFWRHLIKHAQQNPFPGSCQCEGQVLGNLAALHLLESMCVVYEVAPHLAGVALSAGAAFCHLLQGASCVLAATLRTIQANIFSLTAMDGERERWDRERQKAIDAEKKLSAKVLEYISVFCQDPVSAMRIKVDVPPVYRR